MNSFESTVFSTKVEGKAWMDSYLKKEGIVRKMKQGRPALEGNQCNAFLQKTDKLEQDFFALGRRDYHSGITLCCSPKSFQEVTGGLSWNGVG